MPLLDVSDLLTDPDFVDLTLVCTRQAQTIGTDGRATNTGAAIPFGGVVTMDRGSILNRVAEGSYVTGSILIYTKLSLRMSATGNDADLIAWHGDTFVVVSVGDYSAWGAGFVWAVCEPLKAP